jgi:class 3 adenylate cyclase/tetratricopeptide (TPR) repeat protein
LFADLTGYTALAESLDPEEVYRLLRPTMTSLVELATDFGGTVPQVMGDGFMAVFGVPVLHEDDPHRAVRAAVAIRDHVRELNTTSEGIPFPDVHAGVNSGEVMVVVADEQAGFRVVGDTVNVASRLASLAGPGRILVDERTKELTLQAIAYGARELRRAKGKAEPLATYEATGIRDQAPHRRRPKLAATSFVDRESTMVRLHTEMRDARRSGRPRVLVVSAEPGLGKSRLAEEFARRLRGVTVLSGRCAAFGQRRPLAALAEAVGTAVDLKSQTDRGQDIALARLARRITGGDSAALARDLALLLGVSQPASRRPDAVAGAVRAARAVLEHLAAERPVLVIIDDLHWADADLVQTIEGIRAPPWRGPLLFLCLTRPGRAIEGVPTVVLDPLDERASHSLTEQVLGSALPPMLGELLARSGGNPLFLEESLGMLAEAGSLVQEDGRWRVARPEDIAKVPTAIRLLIAARLDGLPPDEKRVIQVSSVAGEVVWDQLLEAVCNVRNVKASIRALEARDLLRRRRGSLVPGTVEYELKHVLIRDVAYASLPRAVRVDRHLEVASWLRDRAGLADEPVALLAHHYRDAWEMSRSRTGPSRVPDTGRLAVTYLRRLADETFVYQARSAESLYRRALGIGDELGTAADATERVRTLVGHAEALADLGRSHEALERAVEATDSARRVGDRALSAKALLARGRIEGSRPLLQRALALFEDIGDVPGQGWAYLRVSETWMEEDYRQGLEYLRRAYEVLARTGDLWGRTMVAQDLAYVFTVVGGAEFRRWFAESRRLTSNEGDLRSRAALLRTRGYFEHYRGNHGAAIRLMREARPLAVEAGDRYIEADSILIESMARATLGPPTAAEALATDAVRMGREIGSERVEALGLLAEARAALRSGDPRLSSRRLRRANKILQPSTRLDILDAQLVSAQCHLDRGAWADVPGAADDLLVGVRVNGWSLWEPMPALLLGRAHLAAGRFAEASAALGAAASTSRSAGAPGTRSLAVAARDQALILSGRKPRGRPPAIVDIPEIAAIALENEGLLLLRERGEADAARSALGEAVERWRELGVTSWLARSLALRADAERRSGVRARAHRSDAEALRVLDRLETPARQRSAVLNPFGA